MKDKTKYTPGPWIGFQDASSTWVKQDDFKGRDAIENRHVCKIGTDDRGQDLANARLIAAAPDMLEALEHTLGDAVDWDYVRSIIAKARGEE